MVDVGGGKEETEIAVREKENVRETVKEKAKRVGRYALKDGYWKWEGGYGVALWEESVVGLVVKGGLPGLENSDSVRIACPRG